MDSTAHESSDGGQRGCAALGRMRQGASVRRGREPCEGDTRVNLGGRGARQGRVPVPHSTAPITLAGAPRGVARMGPGVQVKYKRLSPLGAGVLPGVARRWAAAAHAPAAPGNGATTRVAMGGSPGVGPPELDKGPLLPVRGPITYVELSLDFEGHTGKALLAPNNRRVWGMVMAPERSRQRG